ncbi:MAG TPA: valine--tRNA ligase [Chloroflexota bacterium]|nr:valine--tRNA ligase [Chloroflexota bacterium]
MAAEDRYHFQEAEARLQARWAELGIYQFNPQATSPIFSVDTPPPTVSGRIHIGHVFSYTQADIVIRYHRMRGEPVFYPFGFDDNGLPTERFTEQSIGKSARALGREAFIRACLAQSAVVEEQFEHFWQRLGLSVDWRLRYSTIDDRCRRLVQADFLDLHARNLITRRQAPTLWCPECATALAQADVEDREDVPASFVTIHFATTDGRVIPIATTRPELLAACGAVFVHPDDPRYADLIGATALTPLFGHPVPVLADRDAQPDKGTGAVMCCTFGDATDVRWWREHQLPLRVAITASGRMSELAGSYAGLPVEEARTRAITDLEAAGLLIERRPLTHAVGVHERCGTPVEFQVADQWFIELLSRREQLLEAGRRIVWHPEYMRARYESWVRGLAWDWCISRQRYYGVPFPVWYCERCGATAFARTEDLPLDPTTSAPPTPCAACGGEIFRPDPDVMDTWATSSLSPRICASLAIGLGMPAEAAAARLAPMSVRPNAHDIIRTWDFYTIARHALRGEDPPWRHLMIAGHAQDPAGRKLSKSKLKVAEDPLAVLDRYSADAVRYWTASARVGADTVMSEDAFRQGKRLVTKLWNAARFVALRAPTPISEPTSRHLSDRWLNHELGRAIEQATAAMDAYEPAAARAAAERFFWSDLCDLYFELVKSRLAGDQNDPGFQSAARTLRAALLAVLKLLAPFLPFVTEEIYLRDFAELDRAPSIHLAAWPDSRRYLPDPEAERAGVAMRAVVEAVRRWKAERNLSVGAPLVRLIVSAPVDTIPLLEDMADDLRGITRAEYFTVRPGVGVVRLVEIGST